MAMAEPNWLTIKGGKCDKQHIGLYQIFGVGHHSAKEMNGEHLGFAVLLAGLNVLSGTLVIISQLLYSS